MARRASFFALAIAIFGRLRLRLAYWRYCRLKHAAEHHLAKGEAHHAKAAAARQSWVIASRPKPLECICCSCSCGTRYEKPGVRIVYKSRDVLEKHLCSYHILHGV